MTFHENRLLPDDSHEISHRIFRKLGKMSENVSSAAVVIGALRVKTPANKIRICRLLRLSAATLLINVSIEANSVDPA